MASTAQVAIQLPSPPAQYDPQDQRELRRLIEGAMQQVQYATAYALAATAPDWTTLTGKPSTFPPSAHTHDFSTITGTLIAAQVPAGAVTQYQNLLAIDAAQVVSGSFGASRISASGTASSATFLRGDSSWQAVAFSSLSGVSAATPTFAGITATGNITVSSNDQTATRFISTNTGTSGKSFALLAGYPNVDQTGFTIFDIPANASRFRIDNAGAVSVPGALSVTGALTFAALARGNFGAPQIDIGGSGGGGGGAGAGQITYRRGDGTFAATWRVGNTGAASDTFIWYDLVNSLQRMALPTGGNLTLNTAGAGFANDGNGVSLLPIAGGWVSRSALVNAQLQMQNSSGTPLGYLYADATFTGLLDATGIWRTRHDSANSYQFATQHVFDNLAQTVQFAQIDNTGLAISSGRSVYLAAGDLRYQDDSGWGLVTANGTRALAVRNSGLTAAVSLSAQAGLRINGVATLAAAEVGLFTFNTPVVRYFLGDGTGYSFVLSKRTGSATTDYHSFNDNGTITLGGAVTSSADITAPTFTVPKGSFTATSVDYNVPGAFYSATTPTGTAPDGSVCYVY